MIGLWLAMLIDQAQTGLRLDLADALDRRLAGSRRRRHGLAPCNRRGEQQLVVIAA